jgi:hypothetical protein
MLNAEQLTVSWRKSTYSTNGGDCVEIGPGQPRVVAVRDSKDPQGPALEFTPEAWSSFVAAAQAGRFSVA